MDIKEDLKKIATNSDIGINIINQAEEEQYQLSRKIHILKVVYFAETIKKLVETDFFSKDKIEYLQLKYKYDDNIETDTLEFHLLNSNSEKVGGIYDEDCHEQSKFLYPYFSIFFEFDADLINNKIKTNFINLELNEGIEEAILGLLLNEELKKIYDYNKMNTDLPNSNNSSSKKIKM